MTTPSISEPFVVLAVETLESGPKGNSAETIRETHLHHEVSIQTLGSLYLGNGLLLCFSCLYGFWVGWIEVNYTLAAAGLVLAGMVYLGFATGLQLRKLESKGRTKATIFSLIGLLVFPAGTLINAYFLYLLRSKKGEVVFSKEYAEVRLTTPHIKHRTPIVLWALLALIPIGIMASLILAN